MVFKAKVNWKEEIPAIKAWANSAPKVTYRHIAEKYGVTAERVRQILRKYVPDWSENYGQEARMYRRVMSDTDTKWDKWGNKEDTILYKSQRAKFFGKKNNAKREGKEWTISFGDISWPTHCPILDIPLNYFATNRGEDSPSFDRSNPAEGYVKGNVQIMSWRANRIKNDGTADEHEAIAKFIRLTDYKSQV